MGIHDQNDNRREVLIVDSVRQEPTRLDLSLQPLKVPRGTEEPRRILLQNYSFRFRLCLYEEESLCTLVRRRVSTIGVYIWHRVPCLCHFLTTYLLITTTCRLHIFRIFLSQSRPYRRGVKYTTWKLRIMKSFSDTNFYTRNVSLISILFQ